jgi:hypothetical protein
LILIILLGVGYWQGWFEFGRNPETSKVQAKINKDAINKSLDSTKTWFKDVYAKTKEKFATAKTKAAASKSPDDEKLSKEIDDLTKEVDAAEAGGKEVSQEMKDKLKALEEKVNKLLEAKPPEKK